MNMATRIRERRLALGLTQEELANKVGLQKSAIAKYENGRVQNIKRSMIGKMSEALQCKPSYLMGFEDDNYSALIELVDNMDDAQRARLLAYAQGLTDMGDKK